MLSIKQSNLPHPPKKTIPQDSCKKKKSCNLRVRENFSTKSRHLHVIKEIIIIFVWLSVQFSPVIQSCLTLCNPMDCCVPGFPVHHQLPELAQTPVHWVDDAIQLSHPLLSPSPPAFNFPSIRVFSNESVLCIRWPNYWSFSFSISPSNEYKSFTIDWLDLLEVQGTLRRSKALILWCSAFFSL